MVNCKYCNQPISHTFATLILQKQVHHHCEELLLNQSKVIAYPFLEGMIYIDYLADKLPENADGVYLEQWYMSGSIKRMCNEDMTVLFLHDEIVNDDLYLLFLLASQRLYWVFLEFPNIF